MVFLVISGQLLDHLDGSLWVLVGSGMVKVLRCYKEGNALWTRPLQWSRWTWWWLLFDMDKARRTMAKRYLDLISKALPPAHVGHLDGHALATRAL